MEFLNTLSGTLEIELTEATERIAPNLDNMKAPASARIKRLALKAQVFEGDDFRPLTEEELERVVWQGPEIQLVGESGGEVSHRAPNGESFTVRDVLAAVEETERQTRESSEWFGGVDVHHIFFEGLEQEGDNRWQIVWGS
jgi:hypothetical protein